MAEDVVGLRFIAEGERDATNAIKRYEQALTKFSNSVLDGASKVKRLNADFQKAATLNREGVLSTKAMTAAQVQAARQLARLNGYVKSNGDLNTQRAQAELRAVQAAKASAEAAARQAREVKQASDSYRNLKASIDPTFAAQQRMKRAHETVRNALRQETITRKQAADTLRQYRNRLRSTGQSTQVATNMTGRLRDQFLGTANTIAILDGPLGGIASRFSAFGVLLGRTGLLLAGTAVAATALFTVIGKGIRNFSQFEAQTARINAVLEATGNQVGKTSSEIESLASSIALATLESEQGVRAAAGRLLTFRNVAGDAFEGVLRAATDLAALGFGTVESASVQLAKALEDPRQSLTSLSRAGVTFTRQQREMIIAMVDSGQRAEAMAAILENVNKQVGGAGEAAARDTLAGQFDTIGQAASTAARKIGQTALETTGLSDAIETLSDVAGAALGLANIEPEEKIRRLREEVERARDGLLPKSSLTFLELMGVSTAGVFSPGLAIKKVIKSFEGPAERTSAILRELGKEVRNLSNARAAPFLADSDRMGEALADLKTDIAMRTESLELTKAQQRANKILAQNGLLIFPEDIPARVEAYRDGLVKSGRRIEEIKIRMREFIERITEAAEEGDNLRRALQIQADFSEFSNLRQSLADQNEILIERLRLLRDGVEATEAQEQAVKNVERRNIENKIAELDRVIALREANGELAEAERLLRDQILAARFQLSLQGDLLGAIEDQESATEKVARQVKLIANDMNRAANAAQAFIRNLASGEGVAAARARVAGLQAELGARQGGASDIEAAKARAAKEFDATVDPNVFQTPLAEDTRRARANAIEKAALDAQASGLSGQIGDLGRDSGGGGGSSSRAAEQVKTLKDVTQELERQIGVRIKLAQASDKERVVLETISEITDRLDEQGANYTDEEIRRAAERIAKREEEAERADRVREANERVQQSAEDAFTSFITGAEGARDAIDNMLDSLLNLLAQEVSGSIFDGLTNGTGFGDALKSGISFLTGGGSGGSANSGIGSVRPQLPSADGGGYTGPGPRAGGLDGKGGFVAMLHPNETVIDHTKGRGQGGQVVNNIQVIAPPGSDVQEERQQNGSGGEDLTILIDQAVSGLARDPSSRLSRTLNTGFGISPTRRSR